jgi:predicted enzyme related to lactoylglutathione lyase
MSKFIANLGGAFLYSDRPAELAAWYHRVLGLELTPMGTDGEGYAVFRYREVGEPGEVSSVTWSILKTTPAMAARGRPRVMINYRVRDMAALMEHLRLQDLEPDDYQEVPGEGTFAHLTDPDGNVLELWEDGFLYD